MLRIYTDGPGMHPFQEAALRLVRDKCHRSHATYIEGSYRNANTPFDFICACDSPAQMKWITAQSDRITIRCRACTNLAKSANKRAQTIEAVLDKIRAKCAQAGASFVEGSYTTNYEPLSFVCACGTLHQQTTWVNLASPKNNARCPACRERARPRGLAHPLFDPNLTEEHRQRTQRRPHSIKSWYRRVLERYDFTCAISGQRGGDLAAHHLLNYAQYPDYALDLANGVCITRELHDELHSAAKFGKRHCTPQQFQQFYREKTGREFLLSRYLLDATHD